MLFGLSNTPASFPDYINKILNETLDILIVVYLDDILIDTEDPGQPHVEVVHRVLELLHKHGLFANLKKCRFHKDKVWFLGFVVLARGINIEEEQIEARKRCLEPKWIRYIPVFLGFANFSKRFIRNLYKIAAPLTSILQITENNYFNI